MGQIYSGPKLSSLQRAVLNTIFIFLRLALRLRYRLNVKGLDRLLQVMQKDPRACLVLPNHPALLDPIILYSLLGPKLHLRPLADIAQVNRLFLKNIFIKIIRVIIIPDLSKQGVDVRKGVEQALSDVADALKQSDNVLFYPSGHIYTQEKEHVGVNSGLEYVLKTVRGTERNTEHKLPHLVLVRTSNLWGSRFSRAYGAYPKIVPLLLKGFLTVLVNFVFFIPKHKVEIEIEINQDFTNLAWQQNRKDINGFLDNYYNQVAAPAAKVPLFFWQGNRPQPLSDAQKQKNKTVQFTVAPEISKAVWEQIEAHLQEISGKEQIRREMNLTSDLDMDSLSVAELAMWVETEFGHTVTDLENLSTVQGVLNAATGSSFSANNKIYKVPESWLPLPGDESKKLTLLPCAPLEGSHNPSLPAFFLAQARKNPRRPLVMDSNSGIKTMRKLIISLEVLRPYFNKVSGKRLGILLPCSAAAMVCYYTTLLAGKTPVLLNWTSGPANLKHCLNLAETTTIVTAKALMARLINQGFNPGAVTTLEGNPVHWLYLEDLAANLTKQEKIFALCRAVFSRRLDKLATKVDNSGAGQGVPETAAILFTSGSEALPKAVPLTHTNIVTNLMDSNQVLSLSASDRMLGMLPPFHSLGLLSNIIMPASYAMPVACHPNPTESGVLVDLVEAYGLTFFVSPPSFLDGMLQRAKMTNRLSTLRLGFVGAEKCPKHVYEEFAVQCPKGVLCEAYGVTEASPGITANWPNNAHPNTIGPALPSVEVAIIKDFDKQDTAQMQRVAPGETGMLLARGANVFAGYLDAPAGMNYEKPASPFVRFEGKNWYVTGDLVSEDKSGVLTFKGRLKRFVKLAGEMISLPQIENVLLGAFAAEEGSDNGPILAVEALGEHNPEIVLAATMEISRDAANTALRRAGLSGLHNIRRVVTLEKIPLLGSGKIDYRQLQQQLQGHLS